MKKNPFQSVTRVAIEEIVKSYCTESKFGSFVTDEDMEKLIDELSKFLETSRNLKAAGDRFLTGAPRQPADIRRTVGD